MKKISYAQAINDAIYQLMAADKRVVLMGLGVADSKGVFGTTALALDNFPQRVISTPISENSMIGVALGAAASGLKVISTHQRMDFLPMAMDQIVNHLAKWRFMTAGKSRAPVIIRGIIGRGVSGGWGQASQHAQSLISIFAHIPGLNVVAPASAFDAKGLLISCLKKEGPTIFIEHRSLHDTLGNVPEKMYEVPIGKSKIRKKGKDITIIGVSAANMEIEKALPHLEKLGVDAEWIDLISISPLDCGAIFSSVKKTGRLVIADMGHKKYGVGSELIATIAEQESSIFKAPPARICWPDFPVPAGPEIEKEYYPDFSDIINAVMKIKGDKRRILKNNNYSSGEKFSEAF